MKTIYLDNNATTQVAPEVVLGCDGTVAEAVERLRARELRPSKTPNVERHSGMGRRQGTKHRGKRVAVVDTERCILCGICADVCPKEAIAVDDTIEINLDRCDGCGTCAAECPNSVISLSEMRGCAAS